MTTTTVPAPSAAVDREEWPDADFDLPEGQPLHAGADKDEEEEEDWDVEMDLGNTGAAVRIRPAQDVEDEEDEEGVSTIKVAALQKPAAIEEEDFEDGFALPSDLTQLSLAPLSLNHRSSKNSLEWGDKDHTSSSQSSDAYSSLGFANASPSSNSASSVPDTETDDDENDNDEDEDHMDGILIPSGLFESNNAASKLSQLLKLRQQAALVSDSVKVASPDPEEDIEMGLVIDDDVDFSPSRLLYSANQMRHANRSQSMPTARPKALRLASTRVKSIDRAKSPIHPPVSSARQFQKLRLSPSPPLRPPSRSQTFQTLSSVPSPSSSPFLAPKPGSLRGQKSHSGLKPPTPPASTRKLTRKASLSSLLESNSSQASGSGSTVAGPSKAGYEEPTAASRAKTQKSTSRLRGLDYPVPPTRPSTPSTNPNALRLTLPTAPRVKSRPALASVFNNGAPSSPRIQSPSFRTASPLPPRPPSGLSNRASRPTSIQPSPPKVMKRPKRLRTYGDGTELDAIEDLPTDRDKESRFRVQPKGYGNRIPGGTFSSKSSTDKSTDKGTIRKKRRDVSGGSESSSVMAPTANSLRRSSRLDLPTFSKQPLSPKKKKKAVSSNQPKKKPTLIRNLGGAGAPKVVGDMHWNPQTLRWEGNEQVLRDFDSVVTSTRPALITHLTGSSIGSPVSSFATGARKVGNMIFDPQRMCWISTLPPEEEEPDVFANLADDEDEDDAKGDTIRVNLQSMLTTPDTSVNSRTSTSMSGTIGDTSSSSRSNYDRAPSESGSERGSRASMVYDIDEHFVEKCRAAEQRHTTEMKGWKDILAKQDVLYETERSNLYEIRDLATRKY